MLDELNIKNLALIQDATIRFASGLTCITGETGSGKTAFLHGIELVAGARAQSGWVRENACELEVSARVFSADAQDDAEDTKTRVNADDAGVVIKRTYGSDKRGRVSIDAEMASVKELAQTVGSSLDFCGQHEHQRLLSARGQRLLIEHFGAEKLTPLIDAYRSAYDAWSSARAEYERLTSLKEASADELERARFALSEIDDVVPTPDEYEALQRDLPRYEHAESLIAGLREARDNLDGEQGARDLSAAALDVLSSLPVADDEVEAISHQLRSVVIELEDIANTLRDVMHSIDLDEATLQNMQERYAAYVGLIKRYGPSLTHVLSKKAEAEALLKAQGDDTEALKAAEQKLKETAQATERAAEALYAQERDTSQRLAHAITEKLAYLEMTGASIEIAVSQLPPDDYTRETPVSLEILYQAAPNMQPRRLSEIASGGELSRVMLAAQVVGADDTPAKTYVFDEVDAGVGGSAARALGNLIAELAQKCQVICVTNLAQVAVHAEKQIVVKRHDSSSGLPTTSFTEVKGDSRVKEIARMLSGDANSSTLKHARELLEKSAPHPNATMDTATEGHR